MNKSSSLGIFSAIRPHNNFTAHHTKKSKDLNSKNGSKPIKSISNLLKQELSKNGNFMFNQKLKLKDSKSSSKMFQNLNLRSQQIEHTSKLKKANKVKKNSNIDDFSQSRRSKCRSVIRNAGPIYSRLSKLDDINDDIYQLQHTKQEYTQNDTDDWEKDSNESLYSIERKRLKKKS